MGIIEREFYARDTLIVAKELLGNILCRKVDGCVLKGVIVETEAYTQNDPACHAYKGITERTKTLFSKPGTSYVYFIYGMHYCVNMVTEKEGFGSGILIRAVEPLENLENTNGPSKLCKAMKITRDLDGNDVTSINSPLWLEYGDKIEETEIVQTTRIGINKAKDYPWRFYVRSSKWVSKK